MNLHWIWKADFAVCNREPSWYLTDVERLPQRLGTVSAMVSRQPC